MHLDLSSNERLHYERVLLLENPKYQNRSHCPSFLQNVQYATYPLHSYPGIRQYRSYRRHCIPSCHKTKRPMLWISHQLTAYPAVQIYPNVTKKALAIEYRAQYPVCPCL